MFLRIPGEEKSESYEEIQVLKKKQDKHGSRLMSMFDTWIKKQSKP